MQGLKGLFLFALLPVKLGELVKEVVTPFCAGADVGEKFVDGALLLAVFPDDLDVEDEALKGAQKLFFFEHRIGLFQLAALEECLGISGSKPGAQVGAEAGVSQVILGYGDDALVLVVLETKLDVAGEVTWGVLLVPHDVGDGAVEGNESAVYTVCYFGKYVGGLKLGLDVARGHVSGLWDGIDVSLIAFGKHVTEFFALSEARIHDDLVKGCREKNEICIRDAVWNDIDEHIRKRGFLALVIVTLHPVLIGDGAEINGEEQNKPQGSKHLPARTQNPIAVFVLHVMSQPPEGFLPDSGRSFFLLSPFLPFLATRKCATGVAHVILPAPVRARTSRMLGHYHACLTHRRLVYVAATGAQVCFLWKFPDTILVFPMCQQAGASQQKGINKNAQN